MCYLRILKYVLNMYSINMYLSIYACTFCSHWDATSTAPGPFENFRNLKTVQRVPQEFGWDPLGNVIAFEISQNSSKFPQNSCKILQKDDKTMYFYRNTQLFDCSDRKKCGQKVFAHNDPPTLVPGLRSLTISLIDKLSSYL